MISHLHQLRGGILPFEVPEHRLAVLESPDCRFAALHAADEELSIFDRCCQVTASIDRGRRLATVGRMKPGLAPVLFGQVGSNNSFELVDVRDARLHHRHLRMIRSMRAHRLRILIDCQRHDVDLAVLELGCNNRTKLYYGRSRGY